MIMESIKTVLKVFKINKMRTFLTMLGMIIGIFSITIIFSLSDSTKKIVSNELSMISSEGIYLSYDTNNYIQNNLVEKELKEYINKNKLEYSVATSFAPIEITNLLENNSGNEDYYLPEFEAIDENYFKIIEIEDELLYGRLLEKKDIINKMPYVVLREDIAEYLFGKSNVIGQTLNIDNHEFEVIGIVKYNNTDGHVGMYISYYYAQDYMDTFNTQYQIFVNSQNKEKVKKELKDIMNEYFTNDEYYIYTEDLKEYMESFNSIIDIIELVFSGIAGLSIVVGGIGIMNIMLVSVSERIKETGIRMALGAKNRDIIFQFLIEGIMITILSGIIGIILASVATNILNIIIASFDYKFTLIINFTTMIKIIIFCGIIGIIFGIYPALKAGKLDPVEALKYE